ncbi:uncharacterized protein B0P05DRAFT_534155 [Gilbertella persicaria]|uniref:uncharacterized protein n=1 Tax=Gilbertella persicaria TaxID=101096 RepID=UPI0022205EF6|nr:uncharacterized protein B0P05DRAFT_534155 [Gilbertella persicaria]KAI8085896.1 hypothetical protein B0P05DRAFT_534155 [Gilbertella persicaria]
MHKKASNSTVDAYKHAFERQEPTYRKRVKSFTSVIHHPRRLGSGSACERCRSRKTKCDGGQPCSFCSSHSVQCFHRPMSSRKRGKALAKENFTLNTMKLNETLQHTEKQIPLEYPDNQFDSFADLVTCDDIKVDLSSKSHFTINAIPSIMDQLSCHTFTLEKVYSYDRN